MKKETEALGRKRRLQASKLVSLLYSTIENRAAVFNILLFSIDALLANDPAKLEPTIKHLQRMQRVNKAQDEIVKAVGMKLNADTTAKPDRKDVAAALRIAAAWGGKKSKETN